MLKTILTTTALSAVLVAGAFAQDATQPAEDEAPIIENQAEPGAEATDPTTDPAAVPEVVQDDALDPDAPTTAQDDMIDPAAPETAEDDMIDPAAPETAQDDLVDPAAPETAQDDLVDPAAPETAQDPLAPSDTLTGDAVGEDPMPGATAEREGWDLDEGWERVDLTAISAEELIGTDIRNFEDESVATVDDVFLTADGEVESVAATFGGFLGFGTNTVLLTMEEIDVVTDMDGNMVVRTNLTPEALEGRPEYEG